MYLCRLSLLVSQFQDSVCTLGSETLSRHERLDKVVEIEERCKGLLDDVRTGFGWEISASGSGNCGGKETGNGETIPTGVASLMTCLLGFRCMLRRISIELSIGLGSPYVIRLLLVIFFYPNNCKWDGYGSADIHLL